MSSNNSALPLRESRAWAPRSAIAPETSAPTADAFVARSNGSAGCYGGWDLVFAAPSTPWVTVRVVAQPDGLERGLDSLRAALFWNEDTAYSTLRWEPVLALGETAAGVVFEGRAPVPPGAHSLVVRLLLCWSARGSVTWREASAQGTAAPPPRRWRLAAGAGPLPGGPRTLATNTEAYLGFCREAAAKQADLLCLPEVMLSTGLPSTPEAILAQAISIPGPETEPFQAFCRENRMVLCFSAWEKQAELVHNTAFIIGRDGNLAGTYRKVHLASPLEPWWGVTPGHDIPVYEVEGARIGMNICMDSSVEESARVPGVLGAEILCMPIMGDHRAVTGWTGGPSDWDVDRWLAIQQVRAMDNQVWMVISVNGGPGTCIVSPTGEVVDMLQGRRRVVLADIDLAEPPRSWLWATFRNVTPWVRRTPAYGPLLGEGQILG
jgi:predicted amidohydrolase